MPTTGRAGPSPQRAPGLGRSHARLIWVAIAVMLAAAFGGALVAASAGAQPPNAALGEIFLGIAAVVVVADIAVGFFVTSRIRKGASPSAPPDAIAATQVIVGAATALSGGIVSAVFFFITHEGLILLLAVPCAAALLAWFPSERRWAALRPDHGQVAESPRRSPMVR